MLHSLKNKKVWVAGHNGMVGSSLVKRLNHEACTILTVERNIVDLTSQTAVFEWVNKMRPDIVVLAAAKVGGINANNSYPVDFLYQNLLIQSNVIGAASECHVQRLLFLGSSCIYPKLAPQPIKENSLLTAPLEPTNEWYAIAKIAGIQLVKAHRQQHHYDWISAMPTNLYGPGDSYDVENGHVLPALLRKFHDAKSRNKETVEVWGSGLPLREFMHCYDLADALVFLLKNYSGSEQVNVGSGEEVSITELANLIAEIVGYEGKIVFDPNRPDGTPRKLLDVSKLNSLGWKSTIKLRDGIESTYQYCLENGVFGES